jgi:putative tryptophan/tyrosine transport system substrate-binding protein
MDRRAFLAGSAALLAAPLAAEAQQTGKVPRIGFLSPASSTTAPHVVEAFRQGLRDLGYVEGQNIVVEYRYANGKAEALPDLAAELVSLEVDVIVASGTPGPLAAKSATKTIPIVMASAGDPVRTGLVASLARPGGNVTGLSTLTPDLGGKRLQLVKELLPGVSRVAVLWNAANPYTVLLVREIEAAARTLRVQIQSLEVRGPDDFQNVLPTAISGGAGALVVVDDPLTVSSRTRIVSFAAQHRLPAMYGFREFAEAGG